MTLPDYGGQARHPDIHVSIDVAHAEIGKIGFFVSLDEPFAEVTCLPHQRRDQGLSQPAVGPQPLLVPIADFEGEALRFGRGGRCWRPFRQGGTQQSVDARPRYRGPAGGQHTPAILSKLPNGMAQVFGNKVRGDVSQLDRVLLQIGEKLASVEAIIVNDSRAIALTVQLIAKF